MDRCWQSFRERLARRRMGALVGMALGALLGFLALLRIADGLANYSFDLPFRFRTTASPDDVVIVYMDEVSHQELGQNSLRPWSRRLHAQLVERLIAAGAKVIVFDVVFSAPTNEVVIAGATPDADDREFLESTSALWHAIKRHGKVVLAGVELPESDQWTLGDKIEKPTVEMQVAAAGWGLATLKHEQRVCREMFMGTPELPSLVWVAAKVAGIANAQNDANRAQRRWLNYYGPPGALKHVSYSKALTDQALGRDFFEGKVVFIGAKPAVGMVETKLDQFQTPYSRWSGELSPGVEIHATAFLNLARGESLRRWAFGLEAGFLVAVGAALGLALVLVQPFSAAALAVPVCLAAAAGGIFLPLKSHTWFNWLAIPVMQVPAVYLWSVVYNSVRLYLEKRLLEQTLKLHLAPDRVKQIMREPALLKPGAEKAEISIMFTDIANFSKITGRMDPGDLFAMMNRYFQNSLTAVHKHEGTVIKLIGDAIFAIWNAPFPQPDHCARAARAAMDLQSAVLKLEEEQKLLPIRTRVGLHVGEAHVGNVGSTERFDYTAMGENINIASRLEGANKTLGTTILATRAFQKNIEGQFPSRLIGHFRFKGFDRIIEVHEIFDPVGLGDSRDWLEIFRQGLFKLQRSEWEEAIAAFDAALAVRPNDGPSKFYLSAIRKLRIRPSPEGWGGEIEFDEK